MILCFAKTLRFFKELATTKQKRLKKSNGLKQVSKQTTVDLKFSTAHEKKRNLNALNL